MKKVSNTVFSLSLIASLLACGGAEKKSEETTDKNSEETTEEVVEVKQYTIVSNESKVHWSGSVLGMYSHEGTVNISEGALEVEGDQITNGMFVVDLSSMQPTDDNYNPEEGKTKEKLIGHLSSDEFFHVDSFPTATFEILAHDVESNTIKGNLTIRGNTNEETVTDVKLNPEKGMAKGVLVFDRKKYDVAFTHPAEDVVISDDIELEVSLKM